MRIRSKATVTPVRSETVILISRDWQSRALLRAQLLEQGVEVKAYLKVRDTAGVIAKRTGKPPLVIADLSGPMAQGELDALTALARRIPVWVIASRSSAGEMGLGERGFEAVLFRPITIGSLAARATQRLAR